MVINSNINQFHYFIQCAIIAFNNKLGPTIINQYPMNSPIHLDNVVAVNHYTTTMSFIDDSEIEKVTKEPYERPASFERATDRFKCLYWNFTSIKERIRNDNSDYGGSILLYTIFNENPLIIFSQISTIRLYLENLINIFKKQCNINVQSIFNSERILIDLNKIYTKNKDIFQRLSENESIIYFHIIGKPGIGKRTYLSILAKNQLIITTKTTHKLKSAIFSREINNRNFILSGNVIDITNSSVLTNISIGIKDILITCYDCSDNLSFWLIDYYLSQLKDTTIPIILLGLKSDAQKVVSHEMIQLIKKYHNNILSDFELSTKTLKNIYEPIDKIISLKFTNLHNFITNSYEPSVIVRNGLSNNISYDIFKQFIGIDIDNIREFIQTLKLYASNIIHSENYLRFSYNIGSYSVRIQFYTILTKKFLIYIRNYSSGTSLSLNDIKLLKLIKKTCNSNKLELVYDIISILLIILGYIDLIDEYKTYFNSILVKSLNLENIYHDNSVSEIQLIDGLKLTISQNELSNESTSNFLKSSKQELELTKSQTNNL